MNPFCTNCALNRVCLYSFPTDTTGPLSRVYNHLPTITLDFPAFTFNLLPSRPALQSVTRLPSTRSDTKMNVVTHNNLLRKLSNSKWGANAGTIRTTVLALSYSVAEYAHTIYIYIYIYTKHRQQHPITNKTPSTHSQTTINQRTKTSLYFKST